MPTSCRLTNRVPAIPLSLASTSSEMPAGIAEVAEIETLRPPRPLRDHFPVA